MTGFQIVKLMVALLLAGFVGYHAPSWFHNPWYGVMLTPIIGGIIGWTMFHIGE